MPLQAVEEGPCCHKILIVDDNPFNVKSLQLMLQYCFQMPCDIVSVILCLINTRLTQAMKLCNWWKTD